MTIKAGLIFRKDNIKVVYVERTPEISTTKLIRVIKNPTNI